jgi:hypothetical protein
MSLLSLLVVASLVAAVAFFLAGLLLAPGRAADVAPSGEDGQLKALQTELDDLRAERVAADKEREHARKEVTQLAAKERSLSERLRAAEDANRAAFEREEKTAEVWEGQLASAKAGQKRRDEALHNEAEDLRAQLALEKAERERMAAEGGQDAARTALAVAALEDVREQSQQRERRRAEEVEAERGRLAKAAEDAAAREKSALEHLDEVEAELGRVAKAAEAAVAREKSALERLDEAEAASRTKLAAVEADGQARAEAVEAAGQARIQAVEEGLRAKLAAAETERTQLAEQVQRGQADHAAAEEEKLTLSLRVRAAEEVAELRRTEVLAAIEALRGAEGRATERERLAQENAELREQHAHAEVEAKQRVGRDDEARDAKVELAAAQAKLADLERALEENRRLRDEVAELRTHEQASGELERLTVAHKQMRLDAELMARRLQELLHDQAEHAPLRTQAAEAAALADEVVYLRQREKDLEAQLYACGFSASREMPAVSGEFLAQVPTSDMETSLSALVGEGGPRTAVLADAQGFLIASAGESVAEEGLAAFAAVAGEMVARARLLLPLAEVDSVRVTDTNKMVLTCHLFASAGEALGVTTLGPGEPNPESTARAIAGLGAFVSGGEIGGDETPEPTG